MQSDPKVICGLSKDEVALLRVCCSCGTAFRVAEYIETSTSVFDGVENYAKGCTTCCLLCWLGVGPPDNDADGWEGPASDLYHFLGKLPAGTLLAAMPISRAILEDPQNYEDAVFFPPDADFGIFVERQIGNAQARMVSETSRVSFSTFTQYPLVALPVELDWEAALSLTYRQYMQLIRDLSENVDDVCLNAMCYRLCSITKIDAVPGKAGQVPGDLMMAGLMLLNAANLEAFAVGGDAFTHVITKGIGLPIEDLDSDSFPLPGEVGRIAGHALSLYRRILEAENQTAKFMQCMALIEFLADPTDYRSFKEVKKIIARYVARNREDYNRILDRFLELTGKKDPTTHQIVGYRTRIIHVGERLEKLVPSAGDRDRLFEELDGYIRPVIDHMISFSAWEFEEYLLERSKLNSHLVAGNDTDQAD